MDRRHTNPLDIRGSDLMKKPIKPVKRPHKDAAKDARGHKKNDKK